MNIMKEPDYFAIFLFGFAIIIAMGIITLKILEPMQNITMKGFYGGLTIGLVLGGGYLLAWLMDELKARRNLND